MRSRGTDLSQSTRRRRPGLGMRILQVVFLQREDEDYSQALARIAFPGIAFVFFALVPESDVTFRAAGWILGPYFFFALLWALFIKLYPGVYPVRRYLTIVGDICVVSLVMYMTGGFGAAWYPLYLWIIVGNGTRFGETYAFAAMGLAFVGFGSVVMFGEYWRENFPMAIGLLLGIVVLPVFHIVLLHRLRNANERLAFELEKAAYAAHHDSLTGLANRELFFERVNHEIDRVGRYGGRFAIVFIDLDTFKGINDAHGHQGGDQVLREVAHRVQAMLRQSDLAARIGGDEFCLLLLDLAQRPDVEAFAQRLVDELPQAALIVNDETLSASIGISLFPDHGDTCDALLKQADVAMYQAKSLGKNRYVVLEG